MQPPGVPGQGAGARDVEDLRIEARYWRERYDLLRAKAYGGRPVRPGRLRELERAAHGAEARLKRAQADGRPASPGTNATTLGGTDG